MSGKVISHPGIERWTAKRKAELVLEIIKGHKMLIPRLDLTKIGS